MWTTLWDAGAPFVQWGVVIVASFVGAVFDVAVRRVPNLLTGPLLLAGLAWAVWVGGLAGLADGAAGCLLMAATYVLLFVFAGGGAGDAKLMGAIGAWLGVVNGAVALASVLLCGAVLAIAFAMARGRVRSVLANLGRLAFAALLLVSSRGRLDTARGMMPGTQDLETMPYGVAIFVGVCLAAGGLFIWRV